MRVGGGRCGRSTSAIVRSAHSSSLASSRFIFRSASAQVLVSDPENWATPSTTRPSRPTISIPSSASELMPIERRSGEPISCGDGSPRARTMSSSSS